MKAHLVASQTPLLERKDRTALCGEVVKLAEFVMFWDGDHVAMLWQKPKGVCGKCWSTETVEGIGNRYIYGMVNGQEAKDSEL
jgi:hypothetical protein